jgi:hypothetical protein
MTQDCVSSALTLQFLAWLDMRSRTYGETMEAWRTNCPRMTVWEDVRDAGLVEIAPRAGAGMSGATVHLTEAGRSLLALQAESVDR